VFDDVSSNAPGFKHLQRFGVKRARADLRVKFSVRFEDFDGNARAGEGKRE
jgi:hypothetical protein